MVKHRVILLIGIFFLFIPMIPVHGDPFFDFSNSSDSLDYGKGFFAKIVIDGIAIQNDYILMVANNTADAYNISFTGTMSRQTIHVDYKGTLQDLSGNELTELQLIFVENNIVIFTQYIELKFDNNLGSLAQWLIDLIIFITIIGLSGLLVIFIGKKI